MRFLLAFILASAIYDADAQGKRKPAELVSNVFIFENAPFASCHASSIVELPGNKLMTTWFAGPHESNPLVTIWIAVKDENGWSKPVEVADGKVNDTQYACWNPVLFRARHGKLFLFYKVGKSPREWWGMMKTSVDDGRTWTTAERLPQRMLGPIKNKPYQLKDGSILYPSSTESLNDNRWEIHMEKSDSNGRNWKYIPIDSDTFGVIQPSILVHKNNRLQLLCRSRQNYIVQSWSTNNGETWSPLAKTSLANPNSGSDAVTLRSGKQVLVYNPLQMGNHWSSGRNKLSVAISDDGKSWKDIYQLEDQPRGEFSYPAVIQARDGLVHITYTHDRKKIKHVVLKVM